MARPPAVARDVDRGRRQPGVFERLVHGLDVAREVLRVQVDDRVAQRAREPGGADRAERRAVLDEPLLTAMPPDEVRDVVAVGMRAGRDRAEADGCQRREGADGAPVLAVLGEEAKRRRVGRLEHRRRQPVDDDEDDRLRLACEAQSLASERSPAWRSGARRAEPCAERRHGERLRGSRARGRRRAPRRRARRARAAAPCRRVCRRAAACRATSGAEPSAPQTAPAAPPTASSHWPNTSPIATAATTATTSPASARRRAPVAATPIDGAEPDEDPDRVPVPHAARLHIRRQSGRTVDDGRRSPPATRLLHLARSGPARRMESLVAHLARKERDRLRVIQVDVDGAPAVARSWGRGRADARARRRAQGGRAPDGPRRARRRSRRCSSSHLAVSA